MQILKQDLKNGYLFLKPEDLDDLWYLSQVIESGDRVSARTLRKIKLDSGDGDRKTAVIKKPALLKVSVESVEFAKHSDSLRISGKIIEGPEDIPRGSYHTLTIEPNDALSIEKERWANYQLKRIKDATESKGSKVLICTLDRESASFALLKNYGFDYLSEIEGHIQKKNSPEVVKESTFYGEIIKVLQEYVSRYQVEHIILASPAFFKDDLFKEIKKNSDLAKKITLATCYSTGKSSITEVLKRDEVKTVLKQDRIYRETSLVEELFMEIGKNNLATYGLEHAENAASSGAVKILMISDSLIKKSRHDNSYRKIEYILKTVETNAGEVHIISSEHEAGKKLDGLGGIGVILRYKLDY